MVGVSTGSEMLDEEEPELHENRGKDFESFYFGDSFRFREKVFVVAKKTTYSNLIAFLYSHFHKKNLSQQIFLKTKHKFSRKFS
jgi:hypothetical protein